MWNTLLTILFNYCYQVLSTLFASILCFYEHGFPTSGRHLSSYSFAAHIIKNQYRGGKEVHGRNQN